MKYATTFHQGFTEVQVNNDYLESLRYMHINIYLPNNLRWNASTTVFGCLYLRSMNDKPL